MGGHFILVKVPVSELQSKIFTGGKPNPQSKNAVKGGIDALTIIAHSTRH